MLLVCTPEHQQNREALFVSLLCLCASVMINAQMVNEVKGPVKYVNTLMGTDAKDYPYSFSGTK
jgi:hypothetical protein